MENVIDERDAPQSSKAAGPKPRSRVGLVILVFIVVVAAAGTAAYLHFRDRVSSDDAQVDGHIMAVASKIPGNVLEVAVQDNQPVKTGDVLVRIDPRDYQARVNQARAALLAAQSQVRAAQVAVPLATETTESVTSGASAQLANAQAELERARLSYEQAAGSDISQSQAAVASKQASNERAQADLARMRPLVEKAEISRQQFDAYTAAARVAESELKAAQEKLASVQQDAQIRRAALAAAASRVDQARAAVQQSIAGHRQVAMRSADVGTAAAAVEQARANLESAELQLSYTTIVAPADGVVTRKSAEAGQIVQPGQSLMTVVPLEQVWVTANFKETQLAQVHPGQRAQIKVDMYGREISGRVESIAGATGARMSLLPPENATGNFVKVVQRIPVKILLDPLPPGTILRPGMNVDATIFVR